MPQDNGEYKRIFKTKLKDVKPGDGIISRKLASFWLDQVDSVDRVNSGWVKNGNSILRRFRDQRNRLEADSLRRMNLLWTNIKIMTPALYSKRPLPVVDRKFLDKDTKGRLSSQILERSLRNQVEINGLHGSLKKAVHDYLLPGRGQVWVRYVPEIGEGDSLATDFAEIDDELERIIGGDDADTGDSESSDDTIPEGDPDEQDDAETEQLEQSDLQLLSEKAMVDYVDWKDFYMFPAKARVWEEVQAVGKKIFISREEAIERFGEAIGSKMRADTNSDFYKAGFGQSSALGDLNERDIVVFEIWNKVDRRVYWISRGYDFLCDIKQDPFKLSGFFPCPEPISATLTNDNLIPVPDYTEWQDQAMQIDELTQRIAMLSKACKVAGTYDSSQMGIKRLLNEVTENELIPVDSWAAFADKGGVKGCISLLPLEEIQEVIATLQAVRQACKVDLDEVTGLSDVLRGTSDSRETLGGLRLKNNNAGTRLSERQNEVARFARDTVNLVAELMCNHFDDQTLIDSSGILFEDELQPDNILAEYQNKIADEYGKLKAKQPPPAPPPAPPQMGAPGMPPPPGMPPQPQLGAPGVPPMAPPGPPPFPDLNEIMQTAMQAISVDDLIDMKVKGAIKLLRGNLERQYRIDIETDSTIFADAMQERDDANSFIESVTKFMANAAQLGQMEPDAIPLAGKMLQWAVRKHRTGRDLEAAIDEFCTKMTKKAKEIAEAGPQPSPEETKAKTELEIMKAQAATDQANDERQAKIEQDRKQADAIIQATNDQRDAEKQANEDQRQMSLNQMELDRSKETHRIELEKLAAQALYNKQEHEFKMQELEFKHREAMKPKPKSEAA